MRRTFICAASALAVTLGLSAPANAQDQQDDSDDGAIGMLSLGVGAAPDYEGSSHYEPVPYLEARVNDGNYYLRFEGNMLRANVIDSESFHFGPTLGIRRGRGGVDDSRVSRLRHIDDSASGGVFVEWEHVADDPRAGEQITLSFGDDITGLNGGWTGGVMGVVRRPLAFIDDGLIASLNVDATYADANNMRTYYTIDGQNAGTSGLPLYHAGSGLQSVGVGFSLDQFLSPSWGIGLRGHYGRLLNGAADSPVTSIAGSPDQFFMAFTLGYVIR